MQRNNKSTVSKKLYCKVCHDAGKSESEYTSHYVRSLPDRVGKSTVTCPILLAIECKYCHDFGHTIKYCLIIIKNKKNEENVLKKINSQSQQQHENNKKKLAPQYNKNVTGFSAIYIDSDDEVEDNVKTSSKTKSVTIKEEFPALCPSKYVQPLVTGYASIVTKSLTTNVQTRLPVEETKVESKPVKKVRPIKKEFHVRKSWADWTDSDTGSDDDDEDDENYDIGPFQEEREDKGEFPSFLESQPNFYSDYS